MSITNLHQCLAESIVKWIGQKKTKQLIFCLAKIQVMSTNLIRFFLSMLLISSNSRISWKLLTYQFWTKCTDGMRSRFCGRRLISCIILASLTGSSLRKNSNERTSLAERPSFMAHFKNEKKNKINNRFNTSVQLDSFGFWAHLQKELTQVISFLRN